ncbi:MAG: hypothetical protein K8T91_04525 [Planctomycetes bacterium]|nr:hypothetical protein [Planctomycetota bacterium]
MRVFGCAMAALVVLALITAQTMDAMFHPWVFGIGGFGPGGGGFGSASQFPLSVHEYGWPRTWMFVVRIIPQDPHSLKVEYQNNFQGWAAWIDAQLGLLMALATAAACSRMRFRFRLSTTLVLLLSIILLAPAFFRIVGVYLDIFRNIPIRIFVILLLSVGLLCLIYEAIVVAIWLGKRLLSKFPLTASIVAAISAPRILLFLTLIAAMGLGWWSYQAHRQMKVVTSLEKFRASIGYDASLPGTRGMERRPGWPNWMLQGVGRHYFAEPQSVQFPVGRPSVLRRVRDADVRQLKEFTALREVLLSGTNITDEGLECLQGQTRLQRLLLENVQIKGAGLQHLKHSKNLEILSLKNTQVADDGLAHLQGLTNLRDLDLTGTKVTDAGLEHLKGLTGLQRLNLRGTQVTDDGVDKLQATLPKCSIDYNNRIERNQRRLRDQHAQSLRSSIQQRVASIVAKLLWVESSQIKPTTSLRELEADEVDFAELVSELEEMFDISIHDDEAQRMLGIASDSRGRKDVGMVTIENLAYLVDLRLELKKQSPSVKTR